MKETINITGLGEFDLIWVEDKSGVREVFDDDLYVEEFPNADLTTCGGCGRTWDDNVATGWTPVMAGRCPFEYEH